MKSYKEFLSEEGEGSAATSSTPTNATGDSIANPEKKLGDKKTPVKRKEDDSEDS